jgi:hypothetical protein
LDHWVFYFFIFVITFNWKESGVESEGFLAHELQEVCKDAVEGEKDAEWMRTYNVTTDNTYTVVSPAPEVRAYLHYGLR